MRLALSTLLVRDYDEAISYFVDKLGFEVRYDQVVSAGKRWIVVAPPGSAGGLLLAKAEGERQVAAIGDQGAGRVVFFLHADEFARDHRAMEARGVRFTEQPRSESYGEVVVFEDLYGNRWDLVGSAPTPAVTT